MRILRRFSIRNKLIIIIMLAATTVTLLGFSAMAFVDVTAFKKDLSSNYEVNAKLVGEYCITPLLFDDREGAKEILNKYQSSPLVSNAYIFDASNNIYVSYIALPDDHDVSPEGIGLRESSSEFRGGILHIIQPIFYSEDYYGAIYLQVSTQVLSQRIQDYLILLGILLTCLLLISYLLAIKLQKVISHPILDLSKVTNEISQSGDYSVRVKNDGSDEISVLYNNFNEMLEQIQIRKSKQDKAEKANRNLAKILEGTSDLVSVGTLEHSLIYMNKAGINLLGWGQDCSLQDKIMDDVHPENIIADLKSQFIPTAIKTGLWEGESIIVGPGGREIPVSQVILSHKDKNGKVEYISTIMRDISDRKQAEENLKNIANTLQTSQEVGQLGTYVLDISTGEWEGTDLLYQIFGMEPSDERTLESWTSILHPVWKDKMESYFANEVVGKGNAFDKEYQIVRKNDGEVRWVHGLGRLEYNERGKPSKIIGAIRDITIRIHAEEEIRRAQLYTRSIIDSMPSILIGVDSQGLITHWNHQAQLDTGVLAEDAEGGVIHEVYPQFENAKDLVATALSDRSVVSDEKMVFEINGESRVTNLTIYPLDTGSMWGAVIRIDDITDRQRIEEMIIQSEKMLSVGGLAAGMAHEINNPLAGILQNIQVIQNRLNTGLPKNEIVAADCGTTIDAIAKYIRVRGLNSMMEAVVDSGVRAAKIVENMLSFSRKSNADISVQSVTDLLDKTIDLASNDYSLKKKYDFRKIEVVREYPIDEIEIACESSKIQQVLLNIFKNGAEAMSNKEYADNLMPAFFLRVFADDSHVHIEIEDNGPGMDEVTRKRIFEPFFTTKAVGVGTGLGLSISYFIITDNHQGKMTVDSTPGIGTIFKISLPLERSTACQAMT